MKYSDRTPDLVTNDILLSQLNLSHTSKQMLKTSMSKLSEN